MYTGGGSAMLLLLLLLLACTCTTLWSAVAVASASSTSPWPRPPMGWNPCAGTPGAGQEWYQGACGGSHGPNETMVRTVAAAFIEKGLAKKGYTMLELDDGWPSAQRDNVTGAIVADPILFPSGMKKLASDLAKLEVPMHFGLYTDRGPTTCGGKPGSAGHEAQDAATYIEWGIRQVKSDSCGGIAEHHGAIAQYKLMQDALTAKAPTDAPVFFNLCGWFNWYGAAGPKAGVGNAYRLATDCTGYEQLLLNFDAVAHVTPFLGPGHWPDMDMIAGHNLRDPGAPEPASEMPRGPGSLIAKRVQTQFSMIAVTGAVLLFSDDARDSRNDHLIEIVSNERIIAIHQDPPAKKGYAKRLKGGALASSIKTLRTSLPCDSPHARWKFKPNATLAPSTGAFESLARPGWCISTSSGNGPNKCGAAMAALMPCGPSVLGSFCGPIDMWSIAPNNSIGSVFGGPNSALTGDENEIEGALWLQPNLRGNEFARLQRWQWNATAGTLSRSSDEGHCLGAEPPEHENVNVWSRQLSNGSIALVFVNAEKSVATRIVRCDWSDCLSQTGLSPSAKVTARDLVRKDVGSIEFTARDGVGVHVEGSGGSTTIILDTMASHDANKIPM